MKREGVLYERKIKAEHKEKTRLENKRRRLEKEGKSKGLRKKTGNVDEGYVSPRQVRLAAYFRKREEQAEENAVVRERDTPDEDSDVQKTNESTINIILPQTSIGSSCNRLPPDVVSVEEQWDTFMPTNTQIELELAEELCRESSSSTIHHCVQQATGHLGTVEACHLETIANISEQNGNHCKDFSIPVLLYSTQDLEFSPEELAELTSPATMYKSLSKLISSPLENETNVARCAVDTAKVVAHSDIHDFGASNVFIQESAEPPNPIVEHSSAPHDSLPGMKKPEAASCNSIPSQKLTTKLQRTAAVPASRSYVLGDREVIPGHPKDLVRVSEPTAKQPVKKIFGSSVGAVTRPQKRQVLGELNNVSKAPRKTKRNGTSGDTSYHSGGSTTSQKPGTATTTSFDYGDSFLSTQELLDYVA